jgi:hypothetical protein
VLETAILIVKTIFVCLPINILHQSTLFLFNCTSFKVKTFSSNQILLQSAWFYEQLKALSAFHLWRKRSRLGIFRKLQAHIWLASLKIRLREKDKAVDQEMRRSIYVMEYGSLVYSRLKIEHGLYSIYFKFGLDYQVRTDKHQQCYLILAHLSCLFTQAE